MYSLLFYLYFLLTMPVFFVLALVCTLLTCGFDRNRKVLHYYSYFWGLQHCWIQPWWRIRVTGTEHVAAGRPYVIMSNHQAMIDICLLYRVPKVFKWVSKKEAVRIPFLGWALWLHRDILITRGNRAGLVKMLNESTAYLQRGISIMLFPEGTRTKDGQVHTFKEGGFMLARKTATAILPVVIEGGFDAVLKWKVRRKQVFHVHILPPISAEEVAATPAKEMMQKVQQLMLSEHRQMAPDKYPF